jgi:hypothetical protein
LNKKGKQMSMLEAQKNMTPYDNKTFNTMVPGPFMRYMRTNLLWQAIRFIYINLKMIVVVAKSH